MKRALVLLLFIFFSNLSALADEPAASKYRSKKLDSLLKAYDKPLSNLDKGYIACQVLNHMAFDYDTMLVYYDRFDGDFSRTDNKIGTAFLNHMAGKIAMQVPVYDTAQLFFNKAIEYFTVLKNDTMIGVTLTRSAFIDYSLGNYEPSINKYLKAIDIFERYKLPIRAAWAYNLLGLSLYSKPDPDYNKALNYYLKALTINYENNDRASSAYLLIRIGSSYRQLHDFDKAEYYLNDAVKLADSIHRNPEKMWAYEGLSLLYRDKKQYAKALTFAEKNLEMELSKREDMPGIIIGYRNAAEINFLLNNNKAAIYNIDSAIALSRQHDIYQTLSGIYLLKSKILEAEKDIPGAFHYYKLYTTTKDSLFSIQNSKNINDLEARFDTKQKAKEISFLNNEKMLDKKIKQSLLIAFLLSLVLILVSVYAIIKINSSKKLLKIKNTEIELQKNLVEEKQKEIIDSIKYAKRIQTALITSEKYFDKNLERLNKNKD